MAVPVPENVRDLLDRPLTCALITVMPDGQPQATPVWYDFDGANVRVNTAEGRQKARNMQRDSKVTVSIIDPQNPFHWIEIRGHIADIKDEANGARDHINGLSARYGQGPVYKGQQPNEVRNLYVIEPDKVNGR